MHLYIYIYRSYRTREKGKGKGEGGGAPECILFREKKQGKGSDEVKALAVLRVLAVERKSPQQPAQLGYATRVGRVEMAIERHCAQEIKLNLISVLLIRCNKKGEGREREREKE